MADSGKVCLFSKISGVITIRGIPVRDVTLERIAKKAFSGGELTDLETTDQRGYFEMPAVYQRTVSKYLPQEFVAGQVIYATYKGERYKIWSAVKRDPAENAESRGAPLIVKCELTDEVKFMEVNGNPIFTNCILDVEPDLPPVIQGPDEA